jgi:CBS domain-containing protein
MNAYFTTPVHEYMSKALIAVRPSASLDEVLHTIEERDVSSVAVTEEDGTLRGIVSLTDLLRVAEIQRKSLADAPSIRPPARSVASIMRAPVHTVEASQPVRDAAAKMVAEHIHRVVVTREGRAIAVFSTRDMMQVVLFHHIETPLSEVMTSPVETIDLGLSINAAVIRLDESKTRGLVVVDGDQPIGVFTQADAIKARALPADLRALPVEQVMNYRILCVPSSAPLYRVAGQAIATRVRRILAVDNGQLKGIVTGFDLARFASAL